MVRNFQHGNSFLPRPTLACLKNTGPGETILITTVRRRRSGEKTTSPARAPMMSMPRFQVGSWRAKNGSSPSADLAATCVWVGEGLRDIVAPVIQGRYWQTNTTRSHLKTNGDG